MKFFSLGGDNKNRTPRGRDRRRAGSTVSYDGPERRSGVDRRGLIYGLKFKTERPVGPIEDWLDDNFPGDYRLSIEGISDDLHTKEVRAVFAHEDQRVTFKAFLVTYR